MYKVTLANCNPKTLASYRWDKVEKKVEEKRKWRSEEVKEDSRIHRRRNTFNARHLRPHAGAPTTWGMSLRRAVVVSKCNSRLRCGQKKGLATPRQNTTPFNPRFPFATSHTVRTWTREGNIQSSVTEHIFASRANFPTKKQTKKKNMKKQKTTESTESTESVFTQEVFDLWTRWKGGMQWSS